MRPWATERIAASRSPSTADLATYPDAPAASETVASQVDEVIRALNASERPMLLLGNGVRLARAEREFDRKIVLRSLLDFYQTELLPERCGPTAEHCSRKA